MNVNVLILSSIYDFSTDLVSQLLERGGVNYFRLNKENFSEYRITLIPEDILMKVEGPGGSFTIDDRLLSVFYRQPVFLRNTPSESLSPKEQLVRSQWMGFLRSLSIFKNARWMNWPKSTYLAETKAYQLLQAHEIGFKIPRTKIGNNAEEFHSFNGKIIIKSLDTVLLREGNDCLFTYSTVEQSQRLCDGEVYDAPLTVQEYIYPKTDIRVTIVGDKLFAVKITSKGRNIEGDWRIINREEVEYTDIYLPPEVEFSCKCLVEQLGLKFGAIDLIESNGEYIFIEINPTGEWGWLVTPERRIDICIAKWLSGDS